MEIRYFYKLIRSHFKLLILASFLGFFIAWVAYLYLPISYLAEGTLYAFPVKNEKQSSEVSNELNYSRNIIAISNSPEFKKILLENKLSDVTFIPLIGISSGIKLKEISPNILTLSVGGVSSLEAQERYQNYFLKLKEFSGLLNQGNSSFELKSLKDSPIISSNSKNLFLFLMIGFICGNFIVITYLMVKKK